jgi:hypothetical protein
VTALHCSNCGKRIGTARLGPHGPVVTAPRVDRTVWPHTGFEARWHCPHCGFGLDLADTDAKRIGHARRLTVRATQPPPR